jgi:conjugal transfer pilus assembly protein TraD
MLELEQALEALAIGALLAVATGWGVAYALRMQGWRWTWALLGLPAGLLLTGAGHEVVWPLWGGSVIACWLGASWHRTDLAEGGDCAEVASTRVGITHVLRRIQQNQQIKQDGWLKGGQLIVGRDLRGMPVSIPAGARSGTHTLVVGATGSGKTVSEAWVACRLIDADHGAIVIDPKGDAMLQEQLRHAAARRDANFLEWTPEGPCSYNPYGRGSETEIADKALSGEEFTEPHYLRQAQRYLAHTVRVMHGAGVTVTPASLVAHMEPAILEVTARQLPEERARAVQEYLDSLTDRQHRDLTGVRDRLSILAESDTRRWLDPAAGTTTIDLLRAVRERAVVYMRLDADRRPLLTQMLAAAVVSDLVTLVASLQHSPTPTVVVIDEFSAAGAGQVARLFGRSRSAGISLVLGTQEFADLKTTADGLREQVLGNVAAVIAHRQNVPESAELIAGVAGTKSVWVTTQQTQDGLLNSGPSGQGSRHRGYEYTIHPSQIKALATGQAAVITPGSTQKPTIANINHPDEAQP